MRVGVLASGAGTNLQALLDEVHGREADVVAVGSDQPEAPALARATRAGVPTAAFPRAAYADRAARDAAMTAWLEERGVELVVLAGYMAILDEAFVARWSGRLVNVHPSLLPAFPGMRAIEDALEAGVETTGVTIHLVDEGLDTGVVLRQESVPLEPRETLEERLHAVEHRLLPAVVREMIVQ